MHTVAVLLAAGRSERFGEDKLARVLRGKPVWRWAFDALRDHPRIDAVGVVCSPEGESS
ncbi:MAG: NTP transferase domain-containing protein, partial [Chthonomonadaceae bacterium]|nr:NTP transferase domain-containing protein [Chthonomonadaceae bacterium]